MIVIDRLCEPLILRKKQQHWQTRLISMKHNLRQSFQALREWMKMKKKIHTHSRKINLSFDWMPFNRRNKILRKSTRENDTRNVDKRPIKVLPFMWNRLFLYENKWKIQLVWPNVCIYSFCWSAVRTGGTFSTKNVVNFKVLFFCLIFFSNKLKWKRYFKASA